MDGFKRFKFSGDENVEIVFVPENNGILKFMLWISDGFLAV